MTRTKKGLSNNYAVPSIFGIGMYGAFSVGFILRNYIPTNQSLLKTPHST